MPVARIRNDIPDSRIRNDSPKCRVGEFSKQTAYKISAGTPIGLLLALTYAFNFTVTTIGLSPTVRIRNTD